MWFWVFEGLDVHLVGFSGCGGSKLKFGSGDKIFESCYCNIIELFFMCTKSVHSGCVEFRQKLNLGMSMSVV
jgi:hypothetical protein